MEQAKAMKRKCTFYNNDSCKTVVLAIHLVLHIVLFVLFMEFFGIPSVQKYIDQDTIIISSEEQTNGIESPAITIAALRKTPGYAKSWKSAKKNHTFDTFSMFNHCQQINFTNMDDCCKNDTLARNEFLKSVKIGSFGGKTMDVNESSLSLWSEDMTATYMGRHFTLKPSITLTPAPDGVLMFELNNTFGQCGRS